MMKHSRKTFAVSMFVGAVVGFIIVMIVWQVLPIEEHRTGRSVTNENDDNALPMMQFSIDSDSWRYLLEANEAILSLSDYVELVEEKSADDLTRLAIQSLKLEQDKEIQLFQDMVISKLTNKSPQPTLDLIWKLPWNRHQELINLFVATRSSVDLKHTLELVQRLPNSYQEDAIRTILATHAQSSQTDLIKLTEDVNLSKLIERLLREAEAIERLRQPFVAWNQLIHDDVDNDDQRDLLLQIAIARVEEEGHELLSHFFDTLHLNDSLLLEAIIRDVVATEPNAVFQTVKSMPYESRNFVLPILMNAWAIQSPKDAYFALTEIAEYRQLSGDYIRTLRAWSKLDPIDVLNHLKEIKRTDRNSAVSAAFSELAKTDLEKIVQRLEELKKIPGVSADNLEWKLITYWSEFDPLKAINWIEEATVPGSRLRGDMLSRALRRLIQIDADKALEIALQQPIDSYFVEDGQIGELFAELVEEGYLDKALNLLDDLPKAAIYSGFSAVGDGLIDVGRWSDALTLADKLESDDRESYIRSITATTSYRDGRTNLIDLLKEMPDNDIRRYMADELIRQHEWRGDVLTDQQLEVVQSLLPNVD